MMVCAFSCEVGWNVMGKVVLIFRELLQTNSQGSLSLHNDKNRGGGGVCLQL